MSNFRAKGITKTPGICGGEACIAGTRIAVWLLVEARRLGITEVQLLQDYPHISAADLVNAGIYADAYPQEIEAAISANEAASISRFQPPAGNAYCEAPPQKLIN